MEAFFLFSTFGFTFSFVCFFFFLTYLVSADLDFSFFSWTLIVSLTSGLVILFLLDSFVFFELRDFLYIEDFVQLIIKIIFNKKSNLGVFNVGYGQPVSIKKIIKSIFKKIKKGKPNFGKIKMRKDESLKMCPNTLKIKRTFKWSPKFSLASGLKKTINYYNEI